jgi:hypothetical protein
VPVRNSGNPDDITTFYLLKALNRSVREFDEAWLKDAFHNGGGLLDAISFYARIALPDSELAQASNEALKAIEAKTGISLGDVLGGPETGDGAGPHGAGSGLKRLLLRMAGSQRGPVGSVRGLGSGPAQGATSASPASRGPLASPGPLTTAGSSRALPAGDGSGQSGPATAPAPGPSADLGSAGPGGASEGRAEEVEVPDAPNPVWEKHRMEDGVEQESFELTAEDLAYFNAVGRTDEPEDDIANMFFGEVCGGARACLGTHFIGASLHVCVPWDVGSVWCAPTCHHAPRPLFPPPPSPGPPLPPPLPPASPLGAPPIPNPCRRRGLHCSMCANVSLGAIVGCLTRQTLQNSLRTSVSGASLCASLSTYPSLHLSLSFCSMLFAHVECTV